MSLPKQPRWIWLGGWAIAPEAGRALVAKTWPEIEHVWLYPGSDWRNELQAAIACGADQLHAYSLGAHLLLANGECDPAASLPTTLWAPFRSILTEVAPEGRVSREALQRLHGGLRRRVATTVAAFYRFADLHLSLPEAGWLDAHQEALDWGLGVLGEPNTIDVSRFARARCYWGEADGLVDAKKIAPWSEWGTILSGSGHCLSELLVCDTKKTRR